MDDPFGPLDRLVGIAGLSKHGSRKAAEKCGDGVTEKKILRDLRGSA